MINTNKTAQKNTNVMFGIECSDNHFSKEQCDVLAYTYPYYMRESEQIKPINCQRLGRTSPDNTLEGMIKQFNLRVNIAEMHCS